MSSIKHYGVLGMHWGVRKDGGPQGYPGEWTGGGRRSQSGAPSGNKGTGNLKSDGAQNKKSLRKVSSSDITKRLNKQSSRKSTPKDRAARKQRAVNVAKAIGLGAGIGLMVVGGSIVIPRVVRNVRQNRAAREAARRAIVEQANRAKIKYMAMLYNPYARTRDEEYPDTKWLDNMVEDLLKRAGKVNLDSDDNFLNEFEKYVDEERAFKRRWNVA